MSQARIEKNQRKFLLRGEKFSVMRWPIMELNSFLLL
jgi:hypothetical protein